MYEERNHHATMQPVLDSTGNKVSRSQKIVFLFSAKKYKRIPQETKEEHAHDEKERENGALMVRLVVTTNSLAAQQDPEEKTLANGRRSSLSRFYSARSQCSTEVLTIARIHGAISILFANRNRIRWPHMQNIKASM